MLVTARSAEMIVENAACVWKLLEFPRKTDRYPNGSERWLVKATCSFKSATYPPRVVELSLGWEEVHEIFRAILGGDEEQAELDRLHEEMLDELVAEERLTALVELAAATAAVRTYQGMRGDKALDAALWIFTAKRERFVRGASR